MEVLVGLDHIVALVAPLRIIPREVLQVEVGIWSVMRYAVLWSQLPNQHLCRCQFTC